MKLGHHTSSKKSYVSMTDSMTKRSAVAVMARPCTHAPAATSVRSFPSEPYQMHQLHGAPVAEAPRAGEALLTCPGPLKLDVLSLLDQERQARSAGEPTPARDPVAMCEAVRGAFREEAAQVCELASEAMDFERPPVHPDASTNQRRPSEQRSRDAEPDRSTDVIVRHLLRA